MARNLLSLAYPALLACTAAATSHASIASRQDSKVVTFDGAQGFKFSLSAQANNGDLYFRLQGPSANGWVGVGIGDQMAGALIFIAYASGQGNGVTVSQRVATGEAQPLFDPAIKFSQIGTSSITEGGKTFTAEGVCRNCSSWDIPGGGSGSIDLTSTSQSFIYALGPDQSVMSTSKSANLEKHDFHGGFSIDMTKATVVDGQAALPGTESSPISGSTTGASSEGTSSDSDAVWTKWCHIIFGLFGLIILFPLGVVWLRVIESVRLHYINNLLGTSCVIVGAGIGIWWSKSVKPNDGYKSPHQVLGLVILSLTILQALFGTIHHLIFKRSKRSTPLSPVHRVLGVVIVLLGVAQGFVGFDYAGDLSTSWPLAIIIVGWIGLCISLVLFKGKKQAAMKPKEMNETDVSTTPVRNAV